MRHPVYRVLVPVLTAAVAAIGLFGCGKGESTRETAFVTIGTGGVTGVYYPVGGAIAKMLNARREAYGIRASVEATGGSVYNINAVISGDLEFGIAQSDRQFQAWNGTADWDGRPQTELRSVFSLHPEIVTLVAADDSGIASLSDLRGRRVNIGNPGSGQRGNALDVLGASGLNADSDLLAESLNAAEAPKMLQDGRLDAFFYTVGHPNGAISEATAGKRKVHFVPVLGMDALLNEFPYYTAVTIPADMYPLASNEEDTPSIGVVTTLVTSSALDDDIVYAITKEVFTRLQEFKKLHPALAQLSPETMVQGLTAPVHPGAKRFFDEAGIRAP